MDHGHDVYLPDHFTTLQSRAIRQFGQDPCPHGGGKAAYCTPCMNSARQKIALDDRLASIEDRLGTLEGRSIEDEGGWREQ